MALSKTTAFLGSGQMAGALIQGLLQAKILKAKEITACDLRLERLKELSKAFKVSISQSNEKGLEADIIILSVKPQQAATVLAEIGPRVRKSQLLISIAAGVPISQIERQLAPSVPVVRAMPNTPALLGEGMTVLAQGSHATKTHMALAKKIFSSVGLALEAPESWLDAVTAVSGSGPAYVFYLAESMMAAAVSLGLPQDLAESLSRQTIWGAAKMLKDLKDSPQQLRAKVTSPGGTTEAAFKVLEERQYSKIFSEALAQAKARSEEISKSHTR